MQRSQPPFRADHVGSLLRPPEVKAARGVKEIEDQAIVKLVQRQKQAGLQAATDGEMRRAMWHYDFLERLGGVESYVADHGIQFQGGVATVSKGLKVTRPIRYEGTHPMVGHFEYLKSVTDAEGMVAKMTIPSPSVLHFRGGRKAIDPAIYPDMDQFYSDLGQAYAAAVADFGRAGCRYLQLDEVNLAYLCDPDQRRMLAERGDDPDKLPQIYARMINQAISTRPVGMTLTMHLCRGNFRSSWIAQGGYEPVAEILFNEIGVDAYFMEFDTERAGGFEPLRFVPRNKLVVLGLVTTKSGALESRDELVRRIDAASRYIGLDQLCLSPQCGFASTEEGNLISEEEQWAKLERIVEVAQAVW